MQYVQKNLTMNFEYIMNNYAWRIIPPSTVRKHFSCLPSILQLNLGYLPRVFHSTMFSSPFSKAKTIKKKSMPEKGFRTLSFYLRHCQIFEKTCRCSSFTCLTMPKERLMHFPAVRHSAKQNLPPGNRPWNLIQAHFLL